MGTLRSSGLILRIPFLWNARHKACCVGYLCNARAGAQHRDASTDRLPRPAPVREDSMNRPTSPLGRRAALAIAAAAVATTPAPAVAQDPLPTREMRLLVGFPPGSNTDL